MDATKMTSSNLAEALRLASMGVHVFPVAPGQKRPASPSGQNDATTDPAVITHWWAGRPDANVGIACEPSGLYVVDLDCKGEVDGFASWAALVTEHGDVPQTYRVRTWSGGEHLYFKMPADLLKNTQGKLGPGIDTRGNGYVVAPPSVINGSAYVALNDAPPAPLPEWIERLCRKVEPAPAPGRATLPPAGDPLWAPRAEHAPADEVLARVRQLAEVLAAAPDGQGNATAARMAYMAGGYVGAGQIADDEAADLLIRALDTWSYREADDRRRDERTIRAQIAEGAKHPRAWEAARGGSAAAPEVSDEEVQETDPLSDWSTDDGQARYLRQHLGGMLYAIGLGWHLWDGARWRAVDERRVSHLVKEHYKGRFDYHMAQLERTKDPVWRDRAEMFKRFMSTRKLQATIAAMERVEPIEADALDAHPDLLNTPAGIVDLRDGAVWPHDPKALMTKVTRGSYRRGYQHPDWSAALESLPADVRPFFQLRAGQAATGHIPESDDCLVLQGNGANGKSLMASDGIMPALGDYALLASPGLILAKGSSGGASPERASVRGARFVLVEELPEGRALSIEEIKRIIGTSSITARLLYKDEMTFTTSHTLFVTTNYLPNVNETDDGAWRRMCLVNFPYRFSQAPQGDDEKAGDAGLKARVRLGEQGQHDAIVTWLVEGAMRYYADRAAIMENARPARVAADTLAWRASADRVLAYFSARLVVDAGAMVAKPDLYADFCEYLADGGHAKWSMETFFGRLSKHECYRRARLAEGQTRNAAALSRPAHRGVVGVSFGPDAVKLPAVPRIVRGVRFRTDADDLHGVA
jgi:putative DNA primase/helicase